MSVILIAGKSLETVTRSVLMMFFLVKDSNLSRLYWCKEKINNFCLIKINLLMELRSLLIKKITNLTLLTIWLNISYRWKLLKVHQYRSENLLTFSSLHKSIALNVLHYNIFYFLRYACPRYVKWLFTNI